jgi:hypothetical protein
LDNAGELTSKKFNQFLATKDIHHEMAVPYEHHQNGAVERTNRLLLGMARTSLIHAKLPQSLWMLALKHSAFIFNRVVHAGAVKTPYEICIGKAPSLNMIRVFGCRAYLHDTKFVSWASPMIHFGILDDSHGWLLWTPGGKQVQRGASVIFHEDDFPSKEGDVKLMDVVLNSIQISGLGDFSQLREFDLQDALILSISFVLSFASDATETYSQAVASDHSSEWLEACNVKVGMMNQLEVWFEVPRMDANEVLNCRWVFAVKRSQEGKILQFKAHIVAQGFQQVHGVNVGKTFAPTPTFLLLCFLLAMASRLAWPVASFDVRSAFLHSNIDHNVYI